jgi:hypothetical protein
MVLVQVQVQVLVLVRAQVQAAGRRRTWHRRDTRAAGRAPREGMVHSNV